jgi:very-short-patch-repair endonuclease
MKAPRQRARQLRNHPADAERCLWQALRLRNREGFRFRRQVPLAGYVVDFLCPQARLVVEVDGGQHLERKCHDDLRTARLSALGYRVLRYWNNDVLLRTEDVVADIHRHLTVGFTTLPNPPLRFAKGREPTETASIAALAPSRTLQDSDK